MNNNSTHWTRQIVTLNPEMRKLIFKTKKTVKCMIAFLSLKIQVEIRAQDLIYVPTSQAKRGSDRHEKKQDTVKRNRKKKEVESIVRCN